MANFSLDDLKGKNIRTFSAAIGDFIEGLGANPATIAFSEVTTSLQRGVIDCAITSQVAAYDSKIYEITTHNVAINAGYASSLIAINLDSWQQLNTETQTLLESSMMEFENNVWAESEKIGEKVYSCLRSGPCEDGEVGGLTVLSLSENEENDLRDLVQQYVVKRWAARCGTEACVSEWNSTIGKVVGMEASQ